MTDQTSPVSASAIWSSANLINLMTAVSKANPSLTEQELFKEIAFVMIKHLGFAQTPAELIQDTWFTDQRLPIMAVSGDVESDRVLKLHFRQKVTDADRKRLIEVLNAGETKAPIREAGK